MIKLRKILLCDYIYYLLLLFVLIIVTIKISVPNKSKYHKNDTKVVGIIDKINIKDDRVTLIIKAKEKIIVNYKSKKVSLKLGDKIQAIGEFKRPKEKTTINTFDYKKYLYHKKTFFIMNANKIIILKRNKNLYYTLKNSLIKRLNNNPYLYTFILGDKGKLDKKVMKSYQKNGVSHLFAISGMHITLLSSIILKLLKKIKVHEEKRYLITSIVLIMYIVITGISPSILRGVLFFILFSINKIYYFYIKPVNIFIVTLSLSLLINEEFIFDIGFWYSFSISLSLIVMSDKLSGSNTLITLLKVSLISLLVSIPINLYNFYEINFLSIINNLYFVPLVTSIIFPLSLLTLIIPMLEPIFIILTNILEKSSLLLSRIDFLIFNFQKLNILIYLIYIVIIIIILYNIYRNKFKYILILILILICHYVYPYVDNKIFIKVIDIGQGDSILLHSRRTNILIDTGGILSYNKKQKYSLSENITLPYFKSMGIKKLDYLIITHGDMDHIGEAINIVETFPTKNVIFNVGKYNKLEQRLIYKLKQKHIPFYQNVERLKFDKYNLFFLNTKDYNNENDNSIVIYTEIKNNKILLMGDAEKDKELDIIKKYNIKNIDVLKVGHHGSDTSSIKEFIEVMNPKTCLISVGENNRYGHPKESVINTLKNYCNIYRTDKEGSINVFLEDNKNIITTDT